MGEGIPKAKEQLSSGQNVHKFLERSGFLTTLSSPEEFGKWVDGLSYDEFKTHLVRLNGMLRNTPIKQRAVDGAGEIGMNMPGVEDVTYLPPQPENREVLFAQVFENLKSVKNSGDKALLLYYAIQAIHPFSDGNGRTGRLLYTLLSGSEEISPDALASLLDHDKEGHAGTGKGRDTFAKEVLRPEQAYYYIHRELAKDVLGEDFLAEYGNIYVAAASGVGFLSKETNTILGAEVAREADKVFGEEGVNSFSMRALTMMILMREYPELAHHVYSLKNVLDESYTWLVEEDYGKKTYGLEGEDLMRALTPEQAKRGIEIHRELKQKFIALLSDVFVHPQEHQATKDGNPQPVKDFFRKSASTP